jgi:peptide/nickel transport system permease protein
VRAAQSLAVVFVAATFACLCLQLAPGDPVTALGEAVPVEVRARLRAIYGYDDPILTQYVRWLGATLSGDLGWSVAQQRPVVTVLADALPNSLVLIVPGFLLAVTAGVMLGAWQGMYARSRRDRFTSTILLVLYSIPEFWIALALLLLFTSWWPLLPSGGMTDDLYAYMSAGEQWRDRVRHLVLPTLSIAIFDVAALARLQRESMMEVLTQPFVQTARANGLPRWRVMRGAWRASLLPVITVSGFLLPLNLAGVVFVEQIFAWPGMGYVLMASINKRDYAVVAACVIVGAAIMALGSIVAETLRELADPRLRVVLESRPTDGRRGVPQS